jgi:hypothetical protein
MAATYTCHNRSVWRQVEEGASQRRAHRFAWTPCSVRACASSHSRSSSRGSSSVGSSSGSAASVVAPPAAAAAAGEREVWPGVWEGYWQWDCDGRSYRIRYQRSGSSGPAVLCIHG